ncbi:PREDICTED: uncharacterized protein LOC105312547 [Amphimedon queenslandica]|uniref:Gfo/Idh/MocA-like oxidoreductase N-terminal domain-containing protein n=1 Tax=Amphimedon queenslandica TaxID=400682 RepID=A0A1X7V0V0_AMPQE|nr:PREDICTED: uncharacterized protein LOC105312547 [Amphimedon queenslandica]|eukprot:XP_011403585.2 PREDICTED: uncharacterized protein LOC105312547 [Amphimedon queenslandica]
MAVRVALVGCGRISRVHLNSLLALRDPSLVISTAVDPNVAAAQQTRQLLPAPQECKVYGSVEEAGDDSYDAAVIMVPHHLHVEIAREVLSKGKHVLLEKPLATSIEGCRELLALVQSTDRVFMVAENSPHWPEVAHAVNLIKEEVIGDPYYAQANYWEAVGHSDFNNGDVAEWRFDPSQVGGGVVMDGAIHWMRPLRLFLGDISKVVSTMAYPWESVKGESLADALIQFKNGRTGLLHCHTNIIPMEKIPFFQIFGTKGEITIHGSFDGGLSVHTAGRTVSVNPGGYFGAFKPQMASFVSAIKKGKRISPSDSGSVLEAFKDVLVANAIYRSAKSGAWEAVDNNDTV